MKKHIVIVCVAIGIALLGAATPARSDDENDCKNHELLADTDPGRAVAACRRLAGQGSTIAQFNLGQMYEKGQGVQQNEGLALDWYQKAANHHFAIAESSVGRIYYKSNRAPDLATAAMWFRKAADQGDVDGQTYLGTMYSRGHGLPIDYVRGYMWYSLAITGGNSDATKLRDLIAKVMSPAQIAEAKELAAQWKPTITPMPTIATKPATSTKPENDETEITITQQVLRGYQAYLQLRFPLAFAVGADGRGYGYTYCDSARCLSTAQAPLSAIAYCNESYGGNGGCAIFALGRGQPRKYRVGD